MYAVRWDVETVIKWLAVGMVLGLLAMAVMPLAVGDAGLVYYYYLKNKELGNDMISHGSAAAGVGAALFGVGTYALGKATAGTLLYYAAVGVCVTGGVLIGIGVELLV
ncbi:MAG TPA: hypothetical protein EYG73_11905 [Arcobacter sp.]|nr:hypothetical protein [Arcobacter sp.]